MKMKIENQSSIFEIKMNRSRGIYDTWSLLKLN